MIQKVSAQKPFRQYILFFLVLNSQVSYCQHISKNNYTGHWLSGLSWENGVSPEREIIHEDVSVYGEIISRGCLSLNLGTLNVFDTLVINGNLELKNSSSLHVYPGGLLLIYGDFVEKNKVDVQNEGSIVVCGNFNMLGADSKGSFETKQGNLFLFDETPQIKEEEGFTDIQCLNSDYFPDSCGYQNYSHFLSSNIFPYYCGFEYARRNINTDIENACFSVEIVQDTNQGCLENEFIFFPVIVGQTDASSCYWDFGEGAVPGNSSVIQTHTVKYSTDGFKDISISVSDPGFEANASTGLLVFGQPLTDPILSRSVDNTWYGSPGEKVCTGSRIEYRINRTFENSIIRWILADNLNSTVNDSIVTILWNNPDGEYVISAVEISEHGCVGTLSESLVLVEDCPHLSLFTRELYTFTPNNDNYNDTWVIDQIEDYPMAKIYVYNKLGKLVFYSESGYQNDWDGSFNNSTLPLDSYFFVIDFSFYQKGSIKGILTIIR